MALFTVWVSAFVVIMDNILDGADWGVIRSPRPLDL